MKWPSTKYKLGDIVFNRCSSERDPMMVTQINVTLCGYYYTLEDGAGTSFSMFEQQLVDEYIPSYE